MNVQKRDDVSIYCLSSGPTIPEWLGDRARRNISKRDDQVRRRIELIQDFQMPSSSSKVVTSADGRYILAAGTYPPRIRCYDVHNLTMKFERYTNSHVVDMVMLGEDYGKIACLLDDRTIAFHAHYGAHESIRIPRFGRGMAYEPTSCELLIASKSNEIFRINLEEGRFSQPWTFETSSSSDDIGASCIAVAPAQPLACVGCEDGIVRFWDNRSPDSLLKPFLKLDVSKATKGYGYGEDQYTNTKEISSLAHDNSGLYMAAGTAGGVVALYDVRSSKPLHIQEHKLGMPIHTLKFHSGSGCVFSSDEKLVKIWRYKSTGDLVQTSESRFGMQDSNARAVGSVVANVEGTGKFTNFVLAGDEKDPTGNNSGLLLCTTDQPKMDSFYIPKVGLAPKWCSFLENITEELEERDLKRADGSTSDLVQDGQEAVFENYKFVSREDLEKMGVSDLIGTPLLKAYMHGFFMDINLYNRVRAVANPFEYEEYRKKKLKERLAEKRASRIAPKDAKASNKTSVNPNLAERLQGKAEAGTTKAGKAANQLLSDNRFGHLFTNPDYEIDEDDVDFKLRNPSGVAAAKNKKRRDDMDSDEDDSDDEDAIVENEKDNTGFRRIGSTADSGDDDDGDDDDDESDSDSDEDGFRGGKVRGEAYDQVKAMRKKSSKAPATKKQKSGTKSSSKAAVMYEADDLGEANEDAVVHRGLGHNDAGSRVKDQLHKMNMPLAERAKLKERERDGYVKVKHKGGSKEITYVPKDRRKKLEEQEAKMKDEADSNKNRDNKRQRRGVRDLRLKKTI